MNLLLHKPTDRNSEITQYVFRRAEIVWLCMADTFNEKKNKVDT